MLSLKRLTYPSILLILLFLETGCTKTTVQEDVYMGYSYYPAAIGSYIIYQVDSVYHDQPSPDVPGIHDTSSFYLKEYFQSTFVDNAGRESVRMERYKSDSLGGTWLLSDVWFITKTTEQLEKVEENLRYVRLAFPVSSDQVWNGNILNSLPAWTYSYSAIDNPYQLGDSIFSPAVVVNQRDEVNAVEVEKAFEVYAQDVGLIYKYYKDLDVRISYASQPVAKNIRLGTEYTWKFISQGYE